MEQFAVLWILFTVIVLGNSAVLFVLFVNKNRKSRMNYFIKQLALAGKSLDILPNKHGFSTINIIFIKFIYIICNKIFLSAYFMCLLT